GARVVGADRDGGEINRAEALANFLEAVEIAGVAGVVEAAAGTFDDPTGPQRLIAVGQRPAGEVLRRHAMHGDAAELHALPPVELDGTPAGGGDELAQ